MCAPDFPSEVVDCPTVPDVRCRTRTVPSPLARPHSPASPPNVALLSIAPARLRAASNPGASFRVNLGRIESFGSTPGRRRFVARSLAHCPHCPHGLGTLYTRYELPSRRRGSPHGVLSHRGSNVFPTSDAKAATPQSQPGEAHQVGVNQAHSSPRLRVCATTPGAATGDW